MSNEAFDRLAKQEEEFFNSHFFCPVIRGKPIRVKIAGVIVSLKVQRKNFEGWGVFAPVSYKLARLVREPTMQEKERYMELFPRVSLILCRNTDEIWRGISASQGDSRFKIQGIVPVMFPEEAQLFDTVSCRFDGINMFYHEHASRMGKSADYLRESLSKFVLPDDLDCPGLTLEERDAYLLALGPALEADADSKKNVSEERIKDSLRRAGAQYIGYIERGDTYTVEYNIDGNNHRSVVNKGSLEVQSAGVCLSGGDRSFDLQSLVGVIKEGYRRRRIIPVDLNRNYGYGGVYGEGVDDD